MQRVEPNLHRQGRAPPRPWPPSEVRWSGALRALGLLLALLIAAAPAAAQDDAHERESRSSSGLWLGTYTKYRVSDKFFYYGEYHLRRRHQLARDMAQIYLRFGVTWRPDEQLELTGGIVTPFYWAQTGRTDDHARVVPQFRFWEQLVLAQPMHRVRLYHQFRFEQRWRRDHARGAEFDLTFRFRYKISAYVPLNNPRMVEGTWFVSLYEEIFMQAGRSILYDHFEDNRMYAGIGHVLSRNLQLQAGYMWTYRHDGAPFQYENRHVLRLSLSHNLDLRRVPSP